MSNSWNHDRAAEHIDKKMADVKDVTIKDYTRDMSLESIPTNIAYRVDGVHMYADILNLDDMLNITAVEGVDCHKRTLRFLDQHYRAVKRILDKVDARRVDFHSQRLHSLFTKPYNSETNAETNLELQRRLRISFGRELEHQVHRMPRLLAIALAKP